MDLVLEILERVATDPNNEGQTHRLLVEAAAEITRLRRVYEPTGAVPVPTEG